MYYLTGMPGWMRNSLGYPAFGRGICWYAISDLEGEIMEQRLKFLEERKKFLEQQIELIKNKLNQLSKEEQKKEQ